MTDRNAYELLSKSAVIREYGYPEDLLDADLKSGKVAAFLADGSSPIGKTFLYPGRYYIPRAAVERRIDELTARQEAG